MDKILLFSVLRYSPSKVSGEYINLGVLYSDPTTNKASFSYTQKRKRLEEFDDTVDSKQVFSMLKSIKQEVRDLTNKDSFNIEKYTRYYINNFCFDTVQKIVFDDFEERIRQLDRTFLRFDYEKDDRLTQKEDEQLLSDMFVAKNLSFVKSKYVIGKYKEKIKYDFITDEFYIKYFDFDRKQLNRNINIMKTWAWNATHTDKDIIIIFRYSDEDIKYIEDFKIMMKILKDAKIKTYRIDKIESLINDVIIS